MKAIKILKINWIEGFKISVVFSGYEGSRVIDFTEILKKLTADKDSPASILLYPKEFKKVKISDRRGSRHGKRLSGRCDGRTGWPAAPYSLESCP